MIAVFLDSNVFLDALLQRNDFKEAGAILQLSEKAELKINTTPSCLLNVIYFLQKAGIPHKDVVQILAELLEPVSFVPTNKDIFLKAIHAEFTDIEDAVQYFSALSVTNMDYFITSNIKDFKKASSQLPVVSPKQFMKLQLKGK
jgi:predicted nucleic acid-binding protein